LFFEADIRPATWGETMNEREIFAAVLELPTAAERQAFLDDLANPAQRDRIGRLLQERSQLGSFLEHPPLDAVALEPDATILHGAGSTYDDVEFVDFSGLELMNENPAEKDDEIDLSFLEPSARADSLGRLAHYEILEVIGRGAFGTVLKAYDEKLQRVVAIKVLAPEMAAASPARKRFLREARASAKVRHENVVRIYNVEDEPIPYLVMEFIPGETLQKRLDDHGPLDLPDVLRIGKQIADGLAAAHAQDLIHRDVKPGNVLLDTSVDDHVKLTDFGLARTADDASMTQSGMIAGTPLYMAPEQALGHKLDQRADLFSFGSVLYQMLSGRPPFRARSTIAVLKRVTEDTPRPIQEIIPEVPDWMCELVGHLHAKQPDERYGSAKEVSKLLAACLADVEQGRVPSIPAPSHTAETPDAPVEKVSVKEKPQTRTVKHAARWPLLRVAALVLIVLLAGLGISEATGVSHLATTVIRLATGAGTLVIETDDPGIQVTVTGDGDEVTIRGAGIEQLTLSPGKYRVAASKGGKPFTQQLVTIERGGRQVVKVELESRSTGSPSEPGAGDYRSIPAGAITEIRRFPRDDSMDYVRQIEFSPDGKHLVCVGHQPELWDIEAISEVRFGPAYCVTFAISPDGNFLAAGQSTDGTMNTIKLWDLTSRTSIREFVGHEAYIRKIVFSPDGRFLLSASLEDGTARLWDVTTAEQLWQIEINQPLAVAFSPSGDTALVNGVKLIRLVNVNTGEDLVQIEGQAGYAAAYSPDGRLVVAGGGGGKVNFWDSKTGKSIGQIGTYEGKVRDIRFLPDGRHLITGCEDRTLRIWNVETRTEVARIEAQKHIVTRVAVSPDGRYVATGGGWKSETDDDNDIRIWQLPKSVWPEQSALTPSGDGWYGWPADAPPAAIAPFDAEQAEAHQEAWAKYLGVPVEYINSIGMKFRLVPPGEFLMGSTPEEIEAALEIAAKSNLNVERNREWIRSEGPRHEVVLTQPLYLGITEVTQAQYEQVMGTNPSHFSAGGEGKDKVAGLDTQNHPVEMVSWHDAAEFCAKLSQHEALKPFYFRAGRTVTLLKGTGYRLPTEAEWEYACRAGTTTRFWTGDQDADVIKAGWVYNNSGQRTHPVGELKENPFGLYDVHGNVEEWVEDAADSKPNEDIAEKQAVAPDVPSPGSFTHMMRGGRYGDGPLWSRSSTRHVFGGYWPASGFRVVLSVDAVKEQPSGKPAATVVPPFTDADVERIAALPAEQQIEEVRRELIRRNPGFDGLMEHKIEDGAVRRLTFCTDHVTDISPVRALTQLRTLYVEGTPGYSPSAPDHRDKGSLADLSPLQGLRLTSLYAGHNRVADLAPLHGMPLQRLSLAYNREHRLDLTPLADSPLAVLVLQQSLVSELTPLENLPLKELRCGGTQVSDLAPLKGMPLIDLRVDQTRVTDLTPLEGMPLEELWCDVASVRDAALLREIKTLKFINGKPAAQFWKDVERRRAAEQQIEEVRQELMRRNPGFDGKLALFDVAEPIVEDGVVIDLRMCTDHVSDISPVRALRGLRRAWLEGSKPGSGRLTDLTPLRGMALTYATVTNNGQLSDLSPLEGMPITHLCVGGTKVPDLSLVKEMPITALWMYDTPITDLSPLAGKSLDVLYCAGSEVKTLQALPAAKVNELYCERSQLPDEAELKRLGVTHINGKPVEEFFKDDGNAKFQWPADAPPPAIAPFDAEQAKRHQQAWADYLDVPVEEEVVLGQDKDGKDVALTMVLIPPGEFLMGSTDEEKAKFLAEAKANNYYHCIQNIPREIPQHRVVIDKPFWLSRYEVTLGQFRQFVELSGYKTVGGGGGFINGERVRDDPRFSWNSDLGFPRTDAHPVSNMTWNDAAAFCDWVTERCEHLDFALPTEQQWEYACRAGTTTYWYTGDSERDLLSAAWLIENSGGKTHPETHPVGQLAPNAFGIYDMHGSVWEWCRGSEAKHSRRTIRGGPFTWKPIVARSAFCIPLEPTRRDIDYGFRVAAAMPLDVIRAKFPAAAPLTDADVERISALPAEQQIEEVRRELIRRNPGFDGNVKHDVQDGVVTKIEVVTDHVTDISPVRALKGLRTVSLKGSAPESGRLSDLSPLRGMALVGASLSWNPTLTDLSPLEGMRIASLGLEHTNVGDIAILKDMPIERLWIHKNPVADLSPLAGKSLEILMCHQSRVKTLHGLTAAKVEKLYCEPEMLPDKAELERLGVKEINGKPVAEFWKEAGVIEPPAAEEKPPTEAVPP
jgi:formylglycine-generating enzyme required for sulfatase activity/serine/threonine protein kinase/Leucine-rich repeat (LRR) protein